jgi:hypothetical protein
MTTSECPPPALPAPATTGPDEPSSRRRKIVGYCILALVPVSVVAAFLILTGMSAGAAVTGGCGGG